MTQKELIDYCNRQIWLGKYAIGDGDCYCEFKKECNRFYDKYGTTPMLENRLHGATLYTDDEV